MNYSSDQSKVTDLVQTTENVLHKIRSIKFNKFIYDGRIPIELGVIADEMQQIDENFVLIDYKGEKHINVIYLLLMGIKGIQDIINGIESAFDADAEALERETPPASANSPVIPSFIGEGLGGFIGEEADEELSPFMDAMEIINDNTPAPPSLYDGEEY
jgi:hypothetical protein